MDDVFRLHSHHQWGDSAPHHRLEHFFTANKSWGASIELLPKKNWEYLGLSKCNAEMIWAMRSLSKEGWGRALVLSRHWLACMWEIGLLSHTLNFNSPTLTITITQANNHLNLDGSTYGTMMIASERQCPKSGFAWILNAVLRTAIPQRQDNQWSRLNQKSEGAHKSKSDW